MDFQKALKYFLVTCLMVSTLFGGVAFASTTQQPVIINNVQTNSFPGFSSNWNAGSGSFILTNSGVPGSEVRLVSTGNQIFLEVPYGAFRGEFEIVVRHGNQFSVTTVTILDSIMNWEMVGIGVGSSNAVSQVMVGSYSFDPDEDGNPIIIVPPTEEEDGEYSDETFEDLDPDTDFPIFGPVQPEDDDEYSDDTFEDLDPDTDFPIFGPVEPEEEVDASLPQTGINITNTMPIGIILSTLGFFKLKKQS